MLWACICAMMRALPALHPSAEEFWDVKLQRKIYEDSPSSADLRWNPAIRSATSSHQTLVPTYPSQSPLSIPSFSVCMPQNHQTALLEPPRRSTILSDSRGDTTSLFVKILASSWHRALLMAVRAGFIFAGALFGFVLARLQYLSIDGKFRTGASPGDWYYLRHGYLKIGITLHLATILPAGFLVVFQVCSQCCANHRLRSKVIDCHCSSCQPFVTKL